MGSIRKIRPHKPLSLFLIFLLVITLANIIIPVFSAGESWLSGWSYRKSHIIQSASGSGTNYQIQIKVHRSSGTDSGEDVYLGGKVRSDLGDVRFTDDDGITELDYWIQNSTAIPLSSNVGGTNWNYPGALQYNNKTYFVWMDSDKDIMICAYNQTSGSWGSRYTIDTLGGSIDWHWEPIIAMDSSQYLYVLYGPHISDTFYWIKSSNPEDESAWGTPQTFPADEYTYPSVFLRPSDGKLYLIYRSNGGNQDTIAFRTYDGSWSSETTFVNFGDSNGLYCTARIFNNNIYVTWTIVDRGAGNKRRHIYFAYTDDGGATWKNAGGSSLSTPLSDGDTRILTTSTYTHIKTLTLDNGLPVIAYHEDPDDDDASDLELKLGRWSGSSWTFGNVTVGGNKVEVTPSEVAMFSKSNDLYIYTENKTDGLYQLALLKESGSFTFTQEWIKTDGYAEILQKIVHNYSDIECWNYMGASLGSCALIGYGNNGSEYWFSEYGLFWVEVKDDLSSADQTIYVYYGNAGASTTSNGDNTFVFYDHFELPSGSVNTTKWNIAQGDFTVANSELKLTGTTGARGLMDGKTSYTNKALHIKFRFTSTQGRMHSFGSRTYGGWDDAIRCYGGDSVNVLASQTIKDGSPTTDQISYSSINIYHEYQFAWNSSHVDFIQDEVSKYVSSSDIPSDPIAVSFYEGNVAGTDAYADFVFVRNWVYPEPSHGAWGEEEALSPLSYQSVTVLNPDHGEWLFADSKTYLFQASYSHENGYENISHTRIKFNDGFHEIQVGYGNSFYIVNGTDHFTLRESESSIQGSGNTLNVTWGIYLLGTILDCLDVDVYSWANDTDGLTNGWELKAENDFNIYSVGGLAEYSFSGSSGHTTGGDAWEIWAGGESHPADLFDDDFEGDQLLDHWTLWKYQDENPSNEIILVDYPTYGSSVHSLKISDAGSGTPAPQIRGYLGPQTSNFSVQVYVRVNDNTAGYTTIKIEDMDPTGGSGHIAVVRMGYTTDFNGWYADNSTGTYYLGIDFSVDTWYNVTFVLTMDGTDYYDVYIDNSLRVDAFTFSNPCPPLFPDHITVDSFHSGTARDTFIDDVKAWIYDPGGFSGEASVTVLWKWLQGMRFQWAWGIPDGDGSIIGNHSEAGYIEFGFDYMDPVSNIWINNSWKCRITIIGSALGSSNNWIKLNVSWYERDGSLLSSDILYSFWEGKDGERNYFRMWTDLWFNQINGSALGGGRVNSYFYGMHDGSNPWLRWWLGTDWAPMMEDTSESFVFWNLEDNDGDLISARILTLMRVRINVSRTSDYGYAYVLKDFEVVDPILAKGRMEGIQTPTPEKTKTLNLNQGGILSGLWTLLQSLGNIFYTHALLPFGNFILHYLLEPMIQAFNQAWLFLVDVVIPGLDALLYAIFPGLGPTAFSDFLTTLTLIFGYLGSFFTWMAQIIPFAMDLFTQIMIWIVTVFSSIIYIFIRIVTYFVQLWSIASGLFTGAFGVGVNIWIDWRMDQWVLLGAILYPIFLMEECVRKDSFEPLENHLGKWKNIFAFVIMVFKTLGEWILTIMFKVIEAIPVVE